jgi:hypothetical protein
MTPEDEVTQAHRWNIGLVDDGIRVCFGLHERAQGCEWVSFVPKERAERAEVALDRVRQALFDCGELHTDDVQFFGEFVRQIHAERTAAGADVARLREAFRERGHTFQCHTRTRMPFSEKARAEWSAKGCTCGFDALLAATERRKDGEGNG